MDKRQQEHTRHKKDACTSNAQGGRRIARRKIAQREADVMNEEVEVGGKKREGRRKTKAGRRRIDPAGRGGTSKSGGSGGRV